MNPSPSSSAPRVIIAGGGIAGPVLAIFLKMNGYDPVIYERQPVHSPGGIALALQPNGLRVLAMIPNLLSKIRGAIVDSLQFFSIEPSDPGLLASSRIIASLVEDGTIQHPWITVIRPRFHSLLIREAKEVYGIEIHYDHNLVEVRENEREESVTVRFSNGKIDTGSFLVGCDGLHSQVRTALFGMQKAEYTGMTQMGGHSPLPADKTLYRGMTNVFGDGVHFICYPTSSETIGWIITQHEPEAKETWKPMDAAGQDEVRNGPYKELPYGAGELVRTCPSITKYGLYDRPELGSWFKGRVVLVGDSAHPTSPHLGQGANQAFEDIFHLVRLLLKHNPPPASTSNPLDTPPLSSSGSSPLSFSPESTPSPSPTSSLSSLPSSSQPTTPLTASFPSLSSISGAPSYPPPNSDGSPHPEPTFAPSPAIASNSIAPSPNPTTATLLRVFSAYTAKRLPRTSALVKGARVQGEIRLVHGVDKCLARNEKVRKIWANEGPMIKGYAAVWTGGFDDDESEEGELLRRMAAQR